MHIVEFKKSDLSWQMKELTEDVCDEQTAKRLKNVYAKIAAIS